MTDFASAIAAAAMLAGSTPADGARFVCVPVEQTVGEMASAY